MHIIQYRRKLKWSAVRHLCQTLLGRYPSNDLRRAAKVAMLQCSIRRGRGSKKTAVLALPSSLPSLPPLPLPSFFDRDVHQITFSFSRNSIQSDTTATGPPPLPPEQYFHGHIDDAARKPRGWKEGTKEGKKRRDFRRRQQHPIFGNKLRSRIALALRLDRH